LHGERRLFAGIGIEMNEKRVIIPLPNYGFDPTEVAIPWQILTQNTVSVSFATPEGKKASADRLMLTGERLGIWRPILQARKDAVIAYSEMEKSSAFQNPLKYDDLKESNFDAILLPGGHDKAVKEYLESGILQQLVAEFFQTQKPVAAVCHGVVLARSIDPKTNKSVIHHYKTTALLKSQELTAYNLTRLWLKDYYLTYPEITVEEEVRAALVDENTFLSGHFSLLRDDMEHLKRGLAVRDRNYLSARYPGDIYAFSTEFLKMLDELAS
jgi:protease I